MHLCYSRRTYAACFPSQNQESFLWAYVQALSSWVSLIAIATVCEPGESEGA
jgi:hypothetical protein